MGSPVQPVDVTLEEIEAQTALAAQEGKKLDLNSKLEDGVPEEFKGKTVSEVLQLAKGTMDGLKVSETRRLELESKVQAPIVQAPPEPKLEPELTKDQLKALYDSEPMAAIEYMSTQAEKRATVNLEKRILPLLAGSATNAEEMAKRKYPDEFALFSGDIAEIVNRVPDRTVLAQPKTWDDLIAYVRGQPVNFDKLVAHKANQTGAAQLAAAHNLQVNSAGASIKSTIASPALTIGAEGLDALELEIAKGLDMTPADYKLWKGKR